MLLRTVLLLLLCVSAGMCATLGHYQTQEEEGEEALAANSAALTAGVVADAAEGRADAAVAHIDDAPATEGSVAKTIFGNKLLGKLFSINNPEEVQAADGAAAAEPGKDADRPAEDVPVNQEQPAAEERPNIKPVETNRSLDGHTANEDSNRWSLNTVRNSFQTLHGYFDSLVELVGGHNGVCQYRCRYGEVPQPRSGYQHQEPNGCSSSLVGLKLDLGIPAMTTCCNQLDVCYDTCGTSKYECDAGFRSCLLGICSDLKKSLGFVSQVRACDSMADILYNTVWTLGCRPYMNSQRAACVCEGEERDEL